MREAVKQMIPLRLLLCFLALREVENEAAAMIEDSVGGLAAVVEFPVARRILVGRIEVSIRRRTSGADHGSWL